MLKCSCLLTARPFVITVCYVLCILVVFYFFTDLIIKWQCALHLRTITSSSLQSITRSGQVLRSKSNIEFVLGHERRTHA